MSFGEFWDSIVGYVWIFPVNTIPIINHYILRLIFLALHNTFGSMSINFLGISNIYKELTAMNIYPSSTVTKKNPKKKKEFGNLLIWIYIILNGIPLFVFHIIAMFGCLCVCMFLFTIPFFYPFFKFHFRLAYVELDPFQYDIVVNKQSINSENDRKHRKHKLTPPSSSYSSSESSRKGSPTPDFYNSKNKRK